MVENVRKTSFIRTKQLVTMGPGIKHWWTGPYQIIQMMMEKHTKVHLFKTKEIYFGMEDHLVEIMNPSYVFFWEVSSNYQLLR